MKVIKPLRRERVREVKEEKERKKQYDDVVNSKENFVHLKGPT